MKYYRPGCPGCGMNMIAVSEEQIEADRSIYECLRCGQVHRYDQLTQSLSRRIETHHLSNRGAK